MDEQRLAEIVAREQAATKGPWVTEKYSDEYDMVRQEHWTPCGNPRHSDCAIGQTSHTVGIVDLDHAARNNAQFIAHARKDVPDLVVEVRELRASLARFVDHHGDDPCRFDHNDFCQEHYSGKPCFVAEARALLEAATP